MRNVHLVAPDKVSIISKVEEFLQEGFRVDLHDDWESLPGSNDDPKILLKPTSPVITYVDESNVEQLRNNIDILKMSSTGLDRRHPILFIFPKKSLSIVGSILLACDDFIYEDFVGPDLVFKIEQIIERIDTQKKLSRDLNEASEIALLSMSHSSELGEISRFILKSYKCKSYDELFFALFQTTESFLLDCSALIVVDDLLTVQSSTGVVDEPLKDKLLKFHGAKRITDLGNEMIISYEHGSIIVHNMPKDDPNRHGRLTDNLAVLGNCFEARVRGIEAEQKAEQASRAKTMFLATMSHELRTPMNSVIGYTGRLIKKLDGRLNEKESRQLDAIRRNGDHLLNLINDILDMSKIEVGKMEVYFEHVDLASLLKNVFDQLLPIAHNNQLNFTIEFEVEPLVAEVDPKRFTQIVMNLVSNAIKYTKEGGVDIRLSCIDDPAAGKAGAVQIRDTGIGISREDQERLFGNFVQIDSALSRTVEGSGLGLAISAFFAKRHGGRIDVSSEEGKGSCFTLVMPLDRR